MVCRAQRRNVEAVGACLQVKGARLVGLRERWVLRALLEVCVQLLSVSAVLYPSVLIACVDIPVAAHRPSV